MFAPYGHHPTALSRALSRVQLACTDMGVITCHTVCTVSIVGIMIAGHGQCAAASRQQSGGHSRAVMTWGHLHSHQFPHGAPG
jgi:hypothetical protein